MAKGKNASGNHYTSKGERPNVNKKLRNAARKDYLDNHSARAINQINAWKAGKNVMVTIANPNPNETNKRFVRVPGTYVWGDPRRRYIMKSGYIEADLAD